MLLIRLFRALEWAKLEEDKKSRLPAHSGGMQASGTGWFRDQNVRFTGADLGGRTLHKIEKAP